jgi:hypothetical protein
MIETPYNAAQAAAPIKKPGLWLPPKDRDRLKIRLARPFSDLFNVAASRPAKSPRDRD